MIPDGLEQGCFIRAMRFHLETTVVKGNKTDNIGRFRTEEIPEIDEGIVCKIQSRFMFFWGVGVVGIVGLTDFRGLLGGLPVPSSGRPSPFSRLRRRAQPVDLLLREGPHWGQQPQMTQWGLPLPPATLVH